MSEHANYYRRQVRDLTAQLAQLAQMKQKQGELNDSLGVIDSCQIKPLVECLQAEIAELREEAQANNLLLIREAQAHRRCLDELKRVAEFAQCMGSPVDYDDDTVYLKGIKGVVKYLIERNDDMVESYSTSKEEIEELKNERGLNQWMLAAQEDEIFQLKQKLLATNNIRLTSRFLGLVDRLCQRCNLRRILWQKSP